MAAINNPIDYNFLMKHFCGFLAVLFVVSSSAHAADFTLFGGFHRPGKLTLGQALNTATPDLGILTDPKDFGVFGARLFRSNTPVGAEYTVAYSPNFLDSNANALIYNVNLRANLPSPVISPYVTAGIGGVRAGGSGPAAFGNKWAFNYGGGLKITLIGPIGLRIDARGYRVRGVEDQSLNLVEASVGLSYSF